MATNNFRPFAAGAGANVTAQADYEALTALVSGFTAGKASSAQVNKALRQSTAIASVLAQFIANTTGDDVLDNGDTATVLNNLSAALKTNGALSFLQTANNFSEIKSAGATAVSTALANIGSSDGTLKGRLLNIQLFTSSGTYSKTPGTNKALVIVQGAGAAGGYAIACAVGYMSGAAGGGAGGYAESWMTAVPDSAPVIIGAGGLATASSVGTGGASSFNAAIIANGGAVGALNTSQMLSGSIVQQIGGAGGTATGGNLFNIKVIRGWLLLTALGNCQGGRGGRSNKFAGGSSIGGSAGIGLPGFSGSGVQGAGRF
ncbi:hypothetical protein GTU79_06415 [Sodalis ligni]|uniref:hypothetical protein n=1 Tax=Sodalis ligni TaxID=2697027 RepID=UPI001BDF0C39|nr:hypothetical protein [Sodalis ligni]QWA12373.1 hypothetical protein GTU79_06415 [Sodalis ligni]